MEDKKTLLVASSVYHLLTAVNLKHTRLGEEEADLVVTDLTPSLPGLIPRLRETGLFSRVIPAHVRELSGEYPMDREDEVARCFEERDQVLRWVLGEELEPGYRQVIFPNFDWLSRLLACRYRQTPFYWMEDGFSSYVIDFLRKDRAAVNRHPLAGELAGALAGVLLYEPRLAMRGDGVPNLPLPKLSPEDRELRGKLNFIFDYHSPRNLPPFLFLEQSFRAEGISSNDLELMEECQQTVGESRFGVKPHPRNGDHLPWQLGLSPKVVLEAPWELVLLNEGPNRCTVLTVCSNGALSGRLCLGLDQNTVLLYKLFRGKVLWKEDRQLTRYLETYRRQFAGKNTYVPETVYELRSILNYLGGSYGK